MGRGFALYPTERSRNEHGISSNTPVPCAFLDSTGPDSTFLSSFKDETLPFSPMTSVGESKYRRFNLFCASAVPLGCFEFRCVWSKRDIMRFLALPRAESNHQPRQSRRSNPLANDPISTCSRQTRYVLESPAPINHCRNCFIIQLGFVLQGHISSVQRYIVEVCLF